MQDYDEYLKELFGDLEINLVKHDDSPTGMPCYIEVNLGYSPKDKGALVLDLGNYIHRTTGLSYQHTPEYRGRGKKTTIRWFMSWDDVKPIMPNIAKAFNKPALSCLPFEFRSLIIQNKGRNVMPKEML